MAARRHARPGHRLLTVGRAKAATHNRRLAIISSFYTYAIEGGLLEPPNPIDKIKRRKTQPYRAARAIDADVVRRRLAAIERADLAGARLRADQRGGRHRPARQRAGRSALRRPRADRERARARHLAAHQ